MWKWLCEIAGWKWFWIQMSHGFHASTLPHLLTGGKHAFLCMANMLRTDGKRPAGLDLRESHKESGPPWEGGGSRRGSPLRWFRA